MDGLEGHEKQDQREDRELSHHVSDHVLCNGKDGDGGLR